MMRRADSSSWDQIQTLREADSMESSHVNSQNMRLNPITLQPMFSNAPAIDMLTSIQTKRKKTCCCCCCNWFKWMNGCMWWVPEEDSINSSVDYKEPSVKTSANAPQGTSPSLQTIPEEHESASNTDKSITPPEMVELTPRVVKNYLRAHPSVVKSVVEQEILLNMMEKMVDEKIYNSFGSTCTEQDIIDIKKKRFSRCMYRSKPEMLESIMQMVKCDCRREQILWEMCRCISISLRADGFRVLISKNSDVSTLTPYLAHKLDQTGPVPEWSKGVKKIYEEVFTRRLAVRLSRDIIHPLFGIIFPENGKFEHGMWFTVIEPDDQVAGVVEFWRGNSTERFGDEDVDTAMSYMLWANVALQISQTFAHLLKQKHLNDFLMTVVKSIFQDMVSMKALVKKIINFAQRLVDADRASLFLVDHRNNELYATIFDSNVHDETSEELFNVVAPSSKSDDGKQAQEEIRFPMGTGIAGYVALTGEVLNIKNAYEDTRFNKAVDQRTGYKTETILCMPIKTRGSIIGVVQMINKCIGHFSPEDEDAFSIFSVYCGLALHHAKLYERITRSEQKYAIALEVLSYHSGCSDSEVSSFTNIDIEAPLDIDSYYFDAFRLDDTNKVTLTIAMFKDMFGDMRCQQESLVRFVLTVRKNYRELPYHNWTHGFSVANCMYSIIKSTAGVFTINERIALFISCLCHDLDHRGKNNKFMLETESPLAAMYSTSTMEHHHFNQTVIIIQQLAQKGHNIFKQLSSSEYKEVLSFVKHCILATDLARFFPNKAKLEDLVRNKQFSWEQKDHRFLIMAIAMTGCDLSASAKPWHIQVETVKVIFEEFYQQGDAERNAGRLPIPMMDRNLPDQQASCQVGFLTGICIPCYNLLNEILDATKPLMDMCQSNLMQWREIEADGKTLPCIKTEENSGDINPDTHEDRKDIAEIDFDESEDEMADVNLTDDITVTPPNVEEEL